MTYEIEQDPDRPWEIVLTTDDETLEMEITISVYEGAVSVDTFHANEIPKGVLIDFLEEALNMLREEEE